MQTIIYFMLSALPMSVCFFWALVFLCSYRKNPTARRVMFWFMLTATLLYFGHFIFFNRIYNLIPVTDSLYNFTTIAVYPIYYIYIISLTEGVKPAHLLYLLPSAIMAAIIAILYAMMPADVLKQFIDSYEYHIGEMPVSGVATACAWAHDIVKVIFAVQIIPILYFGLKKLDKFKKSVEEYFSGSENERLRPIRTLLIFFVVTSLASASANIIGRTLFTETDMLVAIPSLLFSALLFAVGFAGNIQNFTVEELNEESQDTPVSGKHGNGINKTDLDKVMEEELLYLNPQLKLSDLAEKLNTNRTYVYNALKEDSRQTFNEYVNRYRIRHAINLIRNNHGNIKCIEDIIYESGFQSKTTFYSNFKKLTGSTPKEYIRMK